MIILLRTKIEGQGVLYTGSGQVTPKEEIQVTLLPPNYLVSYPPPKGKVPIGAWNLTLHKPMMLRNLSEERYHSVEEALAFLKGYLNQEVSLETEDQMKLRRSRR